MKKRDRCYEKTSKETKTTNNEREIMREIILVRQNGTK